jgi:hypothetical protein
MTAYPVLLLYCQGCVRVGPWARSFSRATGAFA